MQKRDIDPRVDLSFERRVPCSVEHLWKGWTDPELLKRWFCPRPWKVVEASIDLRPGGRFRSVMQGPQGEREDNTGCYLEVVPHRRLIWTSALLPDFRPAPGSASGVSFTAIVEFEPAPDGAIFRATVLHRTEADRAVHEKMGFREGWGIALDQLVELG
jgi:uncharacterized protein YndB with AHSA1/START domain